MKRNKIYSRITDTIIAKLKEGTAVWRKSWTVGLPMNFITRKEYRGVNFLSLLTEEFPSPYYLTFLQCRKRGGVIKKGAKGFPIIFWKIKEIEVNSGDKADIKEYPIARLSYVFNISETNLYADNLYEYKNVSCEDIINNLSIKENVNIRHNPRRCFYLISKDYISIPKIEDFSSPSEYYSSLFHELVHWTGHQDRLHRDLSNMDMNSYSYEELIAEIGSSFICGLCGIDNSVIDNQAAYINGWFRHIQDNPDLLTTAAVEASKAVEFLLGN